MISEKPEDLEKAHLLLVDVVVFRIPFISLILGGGLFMSATTMGLLSITTWQSCRMLLVMTTQGHWTGLWGRFL